MNSLVSIIIPVYNGKKFIKKCVNSLLKGNYKNIEIIIVNDGSTDNTLDYMKKTFIKDKNVKIYNKKNEGQSFARNYGLKKAKGEFITFVDQDDFLEKDYIYTLIKNIEDNDVLISGFNRVLDKNYVYQRNIPIVCDFAKYKYLTPWAKLYRTSFLKENNIEFKKMKIGEDIVFLFNVYSKTNKYKVIDYAGYNNYKNVSSISRTINKSKKTRVQVLDMLKEVEKEIDINYFDIEKLLYFYLKASVFHIFIQRHTISLKELYEEYKVYFKWLNETYKKYGKNNINYNFMYGEEKQINIFVNTFLLFHKLHLVFPFLFMIKLIKEQVIE